MKRLLLSALVACAWSAQAAPTSGIATQYIDQQVRPQDDFYRYLNGGWLATTEIPADQKSWGTFVILRDEVTPRVRTVVETAGKDARPGSEARKIADFYAAYMDEAAAEAKGFKPLAGELARIHRLADKKGIPALMAHLQAIGVSTPYSVRVSQDAKDSTKYAAHIGQSGLGMPDRDYYLKQDDPKLAATRDKYLQHVEKTLALAGEKDAAAKARAIVALETGLAQVQWTRVENRDADKRYNKFAIDKLDTIAPGYDWKSALAAVGVGNKADYVIVSQPSYVTGFNQLLASTDLATWKAYFAWQLLRTYSEFLSRDFVAEDFDFYGKTLGGVAEQRPRWKRGVAALEDAMGEAVGKLYVAQYFPPEYKARMEQLVQNVLAAYKESIDTLDWMSPDTKRAAQDKLSKFRSKIGYPDKWRDYGSLNIVKVDLVGNVMRAAQFAHNRNVGKLGKPIDHDEWSMTPQTVNARYSSTLNDILFPAAILQPPFFDPKADDAVNYGAIGAVIGHEISHGFDDNGSKFDGDGNLRDWWSTEDRARFNAKADALAAQYDAYSPIPNYHVNGKLTLGENIADNSGLAIAYKAYKISLHGQPAPVIDGMTGEQRFYAGFGQVWRSKMREAQQIVQIKTDPHSPGQFRANGTLTNQPGFYDAYGVKEGDKMYTAPKDRVIIW